MGTRNFILTTIVASFFVSLLLFSAIFNGTGALTETRRSALIKTLSQAQIKDLGAFHNFFGPYLAGFWTEQHYVNEVVTVDALLILETLNASSSVNVDRATDYIACKQYSRDTGAGGFGAYFEVDGSFQGCNLYSTYEVVKCLKVFHSLDKINQTLLLDFITKRYDDTIGAFHELITVVDGKEYAHGGFPLTFRSFMSRIAYALPNIITTYAGVCALKELGRLDLINITKTFEWVMHCQAENGMFKPYPDASYMPLPDWSPLKTNPFEVDRYGTGIPYTFAAVTALEALGRLDAVSAEDKERMEKYIARCQTGNGPIYVHEDYDRWGTSYTYEAVMILHELDMLNENQTVVNNIEGYFQEIQILVLDYSGPIPTSGSTEYGLHHGDETPPADSYYAVAVFNATGHLNLLNQPTPRTNSTWLNLLVLSAIATVTATAIFIGVLQIRKWQPEKAVGTTSSIDDR